MAMTEEQYINKIYDAQKQSTLNTLKSAYDKNIASVDSAMSNLGTSAYEAKRQAAGEAALTRQRLNEQFAASGLNTGAAGQAHLALLNQQAANLNSIELKRAQAENEYNAQKAALTQEYQSQIKSAILDNDADRAAALYALYKQNISRNSYSGGGGNTGNGGFKDDPVPVSTSAFGGYSSSDYLSAAAAGMTKSQIEQQIKDNGGDPSNAYVQEMIRWAMSK